MSWRSGCVVSEVLCHVKSWSRGTFDPMVGVNKNISQLNYPFSCCPATLLHLYQMDRPTDKTVKKQNPQFVLQNIHTSLSPSEISASTVILSFVKMCFFVSLQPKKGGGLSYNSTVPLTHCSEKLVQLILHEYSILYSASDRAGRHMSIYFPVLVTVYLSLSLAVSGVPTSNQICEISLIVELQHRQEDQGIKHRVNKLLVQASL